MAARVFAVPVFDKWLVFAPLDRVAALVNRAALTDFPEELAAALAGEPGPEPRPREGPIDPQFLGLVPTRACNLSCAYCGFGATPHGEQMDPRLAAAGVDWMAEYAARSGRRTLDVHFFGGEPFAAPDVVDVAVHRTRAAAAEKGLLPYLEVATNGIYNEARALWVGDYFNTVVLSFDGFRVVQDRHRPAAGGRGSFDLVVSTARVLSAAPAAACFRVCVAQDNVEQLAETVEWFLEEFRPTSIDFETLQPTPESERAGLRPPDPYVFAAHFRDARRVACHHGVEPVYAAAITDEPRITFCPVGNDTLILHPDGRVSACYLLECDWQARGLNLNLGRLDASGAIELPAEDVERVRQVVDNKSCCRDCFCRWTCAGGCHVNHSFPGCPTTYDDFCVQTRLITACSLLDGLGLERMADELMADRVEMQRLALRPSDRLEDCRGGA
jgi:uncharacterized protein